MLNQMLMETGDAEVIVNVQNSQERPIGVLIYLVSYYPKKRYSRNDRLLFTTTNKFLHVQVC